MKHHYDIPRVSIRLRGRASLIYGCGLLLLILLIRHIWFVASWRRSRGLALILLMYFILTGIQWILAWLERPLTVDATQQGRLDAMKVTISIPVYNEDPEVLDRVLFALFQQTRPPDRVQVVDDGSKVSYTEVREWWETRADPSVDFSWVRQANAGKKRAQERTFRGDDADVFITLDSDTVLEANAISEGLKPFADSRVQSVSRPGTRLEQRLEPADPAQ